MSHAVESEGIGVLPYLLNEGHNSRLFKVLFLLQMRRFPHTALAFLSVTALALGARFQNVPMDKNRQKTISYSFKSNLNTSLTTKPTILWAFGNKVYRVSPRESCELRFMGKGHFTKIERYWSLSFYEVLLDLSFIVLFSSIFSFAELIVCHPFKYL